MECYRYVELNPVRAQGMADTPGAYPWSSYRTNAYGRDGAWLVGHPLFKALGRSPSKRQNAYQALFYEPLDAEALQEIRQSAKQGVVLGSESFRTQVENASDIRARPLRRGRPRKDREAINRV